jgi:hypothetical protein
MPTGVYERSIKEKERLKILGIRFASLGAKAKNAKYPQNGINNPNYKHGLRANDNRCQDEVYRLVRAAIEKGQIKKDKCEMCSEKKDILAHHDDYTEPLNIKWLCRKHHSSWHKKNGSPVKIFMEFKSAQKGGKYGIHNFKRG